MWLCVHLPAFPPGLFSCPVSVAWQWHGCGSQLRVLFSCFVSTHQYHVQKHGAKLFSFRDCLLSHFVSSFVIAQFPRSAKLHPHRNHLYLPRQEDHPSQKAATSGCEKNPCVFPG